MSDQIRSHGAPRSHPGTGLRNNGVESFGALPNIRTVAVLAKAPTLLTSTSMSIALADEYNRGHLAISRESLDRGYSFAGGGGESNARCAYESMCLRETTPSCESCSATALGMSHNWDDTT
jgi:hypothetical protein